MNRMAGIPGLVMIALGVTWSFARAETSVYSSAAAACSLVTTAEVERAVGHRVEEKPYAYNFPTGGSSCTYARTQVQIVVFSGAGSDQKYNSYLTSSRVTDAKKVPVSGIGRSAYFLFPNNKNTVILSVNVGGSTVGVSMVAPFGTPLDTLKPKLMAMARAVAARLR
ncbi:MAG TPA: hypothetical protein VM166_06285 [Gemmatimonadaceae bacterium]|nr:hypothetical protein [Gemmatimonadaceae bacterium]